MPERKSKATKNAGVETRVRSIGYLGIPGGGVAGAVDVKDGKILRIRPLHYEWKFKWEDMNPWQVKRNGQTFGPSRKSLPGPFSIAYKKRVYSPNRIKYPLKKRDWDPRGGG